MKTLRLSCAFILFFIIAHSSIGRVIFKSVNLQSGTPMNYPGEIDFNGDGIIDIKISFQSYSVPVQMSPAYFCNTNVGVPRDGYGELIRFDPYNGSGFYTSPNTGLASGIFINDLRSFTSTSTIFYQRGGPEYMRDMTNNCYFNNPAYQYTATGLWSANPQGYLGVRFKINGLWHYGYLKIVVDNNVYVGLPGHFLITEIGYEEVPGYGITTGDKNGFYPSLPAGTYNTIKGKAFLDLDKDCVADAGEPVIKNAVITAKSGVNCFYALTDASGNYSLDVQNGSLTYQLSISHDTLAGQNFHINCLPTDVAFTGTGAITSNKNFGIQINNCPVVSVSIDSDRRRRCFRNNTRVYYGNRGGGQAVNGMIKVVYPQYVKPISSVPAWSSRNGDTLFYNIGNLAALTSGQIRIVDSVVCDNENIRGLTQCTKAIISIDNGCASPGAWDNSDMILNASCLSSQTKVVMKNTGSGNMSDSAYYRLFLDNVEVQKLKYKLAAGEEKIILFNNEGKAVRAEADLTPGHPFKRTEITVIEGCGDLSSPTISKGVINNMPVNGTDPKVSVSCLPIRDSYDPNDKQVFPAGFGAGNKILPNQRMHFQIRFQNTGSDTAYTVIVMDTLSENLDITGLRIESASHNYKLELCGKNKAVLKFVFGGIMLVDKTTNEPASHGYVSFSVMQKADLPVGTLVKNKAYIFFDYNSPIITNETSNEIFSGHMKRPSIVFSNLTKTYGDPAFNLSLTSPSGGPQSFTLLEGTAANVSGNGSVSILSAGTVQVKGQVAELGEYVQWSDTMTLVVQKAILTVTAENKIRNEGDANPSLSYTYNGFVYGESESVLSGAPEVITLANASSVPGTYPITISAGSLSASNYAFQFVDGSLEIQALTGINPALSSAMNIYPNPSLTGQLMIDTKEEIEMVVLINSLGETEKYFSQNIETSFKGVVEMIVYTKQGMAQKRLLIY